MEVPAIYSNRFASSYSVETVWHVLSVARFDAGDRPRCDPECGWFFAEKEGCKVIVEWISTTGLNVRFSDAPVEKIRQEVAELLSRAKLPEDHVI